MRWFSKTGVQQYQIQPPHDNTVTVFYVLQYLFKSQEWKDDNGIAGAE